MTGVQHALALAKCFSCRVPVLRYHIIQHNRCIYIYIYESCAYISLVPLSLCMLQRLLANTTKNVHTYVCIMHVLSHLLPKMFPRRNCHPLKSKTPIMEMSTGCCSLDRNNRCNKRSARAKLQFLRNRTRLCSASKETSKSVALLNTSN